MKRYKRIFKEISGVKSVAIRQVAGEESFIDFVMKQDKVNREQANKVLNIYKQFKLIKIDPVMGTFRIKHGSFLDKETINRAINNYYWNEKKKKWEEK